MLSHAILVALLAAQTHAQTIDWNSSARPLVSGILTPLQPPPSNTPEQSEYPESVSRPPRTDANPRNDVTSRACRSRDEGYSVCTEGDDTEISLFNFSNEGGNAVVPGRYDPSQGFPQRWFEFNFPGQARQDAYFAVSDMASGKLSQTQESYFMVFPRKVLPSIRARGASYVVTLPTGETVLFDAATKEVKGGALSEDGAIALGVSPRLSYHGTGVLIRVNRAGEDPRIKTAATITKGATSCKVPSSQLWQQGGYVHFNFPTDEGFDAFLRAHCRFGL